MFSGPSHAANPSSVSRMSNLEFGRRSSDNWSKSRRKSRDSLGSQFSRHRRSSVDSQVSRQSIEPGVDQDETDENFLLLSDDDNRSRGKRDHEPSSPQRNSVFGNLVNLFGRSTAGGPIHRRPSISQRSSTSRFSRGSRRSRHSGASENGLETDEEGEERWGYSSAEEDDSEDEPANLLRDNASISASMQYDSEPPSPTEPTQTLPLLTMDPIFGGETRIDMDVSFTLLDPPPIGPPSRQTIYIADEDSTIRFIGYEVIKWREWMWRLGCILSFGILALLGHWFPRLWLRWVAQERAFIDSHNGFIVVEVRSCHIFLSLTSSPKASRLTERSHCCLSVLWTITIIYSPYSPLMSRLINLPSFTGPVWSRNLMNIWIPRTVH